MTLLMQCAEVIAQDLLHHILEYASKLLVGESIRVSFGFRLSSKSESTPREASKSASRRSAWLWARYLLVKVIL